MLVEELAFFLQPYDDDDGCLEVFEEFPIFIFKLF